MLFKPPKIEKIFKLVLLKVKILLYYSFFNYQYTLNKKLGVKPNENLSTTTIGSLTELLPVYSLLIWLFLL